MFKTMVEIYCTSEITYFFRAKDILSENGIKFKTDTINNELRLAMNNVRGNNIVLDRSGIKNFYKISVEKKDEKKARELLKKRLNNSTKKEASIWKDM